MRFAALLALSAYLSACDPTPIPCLDVEDLRSWTTIAVGASARMQVDACERLTSARLTIAEGGSVRMARDFTLGKPATLALIGSVAQPCNAASVELSIGEVRQRLTSFPAVLRVSAQAGQAVDAVALWAGRCDELYVSLRSEVE